MNDIVNRPDAPAEGMSAAAAASAARLPAEGPPPVDAGAAPAESPAAATHPIYDGIAGPIGGIVMVNSLLGILTLGFYRFWGSTRLRRYIWSNIRLWDDPFVYTGRGMELFVGFLMALLVLIPVIIGFGGLSFLAASWSPIVQPLTDVVFYAFLYFLIGVAIFRARRYRMSRTTWRQIRAGQTGSGLRYGLIWFGYGLLTLVTLGLAAQVKAVRLERYTMENTWFGDRSFAFEGRARDIFRRWFACWLLAIPTLGLSLLWFSAYRTRYFAACTRFENLRFALPIQFGDLFRILAPYLVTVSVLTFLVAFSFADATKVLTSAASGNPPDSATITAALATAGIAYAVLFMIVFPVIGAMMITHRSLALYCSRLSIIGTPNFVAIAQSTQETPHVGEGLADALGVGGF